MNNQFRNADDSEINALAELWYSGWRDAHRDILPQELARLRTRENFRERMREHLSNVRVAGPVGAPLGFTMLQGDELYQFYVAANARGTGLAAGLMDDAVMQLRNNGVKKTWLACAIGNNRAARFYEKQGWQRTGTIIKELPTQAGVISLQVWRYELNVKV